MKFSVTLAIALFLLVLVNAQTDQPTEASGSVSQTESSTTPTGTSTSTSPSTTSNPANITVQVAPNGNMSYSPSNFSATAGSVVTFVFPKDSTHSVTQGSFDNACQYLNASDGNPAGFDSGSQSGSRYTITIVNSSEPVWFFCKYAKHCGFGMVGAINAPSTGNDTFEAYLAAAKALGTSETTIPDNGPVTGGVAAVATGLAIPISGNSSTSSSASHLVANGLFILLAAAFGITLA